MSERSAYRKLCADLERAKQNLERINDSIHKLLDEIDRKASARIKREYKEWMDRDD